MVKNGLKDWVLQRISSWVIGTYAIFILVYLCIHPEVDYVSWKLLFDNIGVRIFSLATLLSIIIHAWIGVWTIFTDYIKLQWLRLALQALVILALTYYFFWGVEILWGL